MKKTQSDIYKECLLKVQESLSPKEIQELCGRSLILLEDQDQIATIKDSAQERIREIYWARSVVNGYIEGTLRDSPIRQSAEKALDLLTTVFLLGCEEERKKISSVDTPEKNN